MAHSFRCVSNLEVVECDVGHLSPDLLGQLLDCCPHRAQLGLQGTRLEHLQLSDEFLISYAAKFKRLHLGEGDSRFSEQAVLDFVFQESAEEVYLGVESTAITSWFPSRLLQRAQQSTTDNEVFLWLLHGAWNAANDHLPGLQGFDDYRTETDDAAVEYRLPPAGQVQYFLELERNEITFRRLRLKRSGQA